jgi:hypothetical protein
MLTTLELDDELLAKALVLTGLPDRVSVVREALHALNQRESKRRVDQVSSSTYVDSSEVFSELEAQRTSGTLAAKIRGVQPRYQSSKSPPGMLEELQPDGTVIIGRFESGAFRKLT